MAFFTGVENKDEVRSLVTQDLKEIGIKVPNPKKSRKNSQDTKGNTAGVFGSPLHTLPCVETDECGQVPRFLTDAFACIKKNVDTEGLFRKNGSVARQKLLKDAIDRGESVQESHVFDVTSLVKRFFRELPDCLFTSNLYDSFIQAGSFDDPEDRAKALLLLSILLPKAHLCALRFTMMSLASVAAKSVLNKMDTSNLAVVLTPNFLRADKNDNQLQAQTEVVEFFIQNAAQIGIVSDDLAERAQMMSSCFVNGDELDGMNDSRQKKKKRRSGSLQGLVSNIKESLVKWRKTGSRQSLTSDSMLSSNQDCDSSAMDVDLTGGFVDATPKVMRKRKAEDDMAPFSATKRKAILQQISTPYTPASVMRSVKKTAGGPVQKFDASPIIEFSQGAAVPEFVGSPDVKKVVSPKKKKRPETPKQSPARKSKRGGFLRRLSGGNKNTSQNEGFPAIGSRLAGEKTVMTETPGGKLKADKKKNSVFRKHKKHPSSPARMLGPNMLQNKARGVLGENVGSGDTVDGGNVSLLQDTENGLNLSDLELARQLQRDLMCASPAVKAPVEPESHEPRPSRSHCRALSADRAALKRGRPNAVQNGLGGRRGMSPIRCAAQATPSSPFQRKGSLRGSFRKCDISLPVSVKIPDNHKSLKDSSSVIPAGEKAKILLENLKREKLNSAVMKPTSPVKDPIAKNAASESYISTYSADIPVVKESHQSPKPGSDEVVEDDVFKVPVVAPKIVDESMTDSPDSSLNSTNSSSASVITVIDRYGPITNIPQTSSRLSTYDKIKPLQVSSNSLKSLPEANDVSLLKESVEPSVLIQEKPVDLTESGILCTDGLSENAHIVEPGHDVAKAHTSSSTKKYASFENLRRAQQPAKPVRRAKSMYDRRECSNEMPVDAPMKVQSQISETASMEWEKSENDEDMNATNSSPFKLRLPQSMSPAKPVHESVVNLQEVRKVTSIVPNFGPSQPESCVPQKPVHESVLNLQDVACVSANVEVFRQIQERNDDRGLAEKHFSPHRFPNSALRRRGSPVRVPTIFARTDQEAQRFRELARQAIKRRGSVSRKPNIPIGTELLKSCSVESALVRLQKDQRTEMMPTKVQSVPPPEIFERSLSEARRRRLSKSCSESVDEEEIASGSTLTAVESETMEVTIEEETRECKTSEDCDPMPSEQKVLSSLQEEILNVLLKKEGDIDHVQDSPATSLMDTINDVCTPLSEKVTVHSDRIPKTPSRFSSATNLHTPAAGDLDELTASQGADPGSGKVVRKRRRRSAPMSATQCMSRERQVDMAEVRKSLMPNPDSSVCTDSTSGGLADVPVTPKPMQTQPFMEYYNLLKNSADKASLPSTPVQCSRPPLKECNNSSAAMNPEPKLTTATPVIKPGLITRDLSRLRTPAGLTPRNMRSSSRLQLVTPGSHRRYRSPLKPVKRLNSPGSPRSPRHTKSPRRFPTSPVRPGKQNVGNKTDLSPIPAHVRDNFELY